MAGTSGYDSSDARTRRVALRDRSCITRGELVLLSVGMWLSGVCLLALLPVVLMPRLGPALGPGGHLLAVLRRLAAAAARDAARPGRARRLRADHGPGGDGGDRRLLRARGAARTGPARGLTQRGLVYSGREGPGDRLRRAAPRPGAERRVGHAGDAVASGRAAALRTRDRAIGAAPRSRRLAAEDDGLAAVVVGWPRRLDGTPDRADAGGRGVRPRARARRRAGGAAGRAAQLGGGRVAARRYASATGGCASARSMLLPPPWCCRTTWTARVRA